MLITRRGAVGRRQRGVSIIEFMVGIAVGLFVVGGAAKLFVDYVVSNRRLLTETRLNQDLRAAADLVGRDLRRASYWRNATAGVYNGASAPTLTNPYGGISYDAVAGELIYSYSKDNVDALDTTTEEFKFRVNGGALQMRLNNAWQAITDPQTMTVNAADFSVTETAPRVVDLYETCPCIGKLTCTKTSFQNPDSATGLKGVNFDNRPRVIIRQYVLQMTGRSTADTSVVRQIRETIRPRNDQALGSCPA